MSSPIDLIAPDDLRIIVNTQANVLLIGAVPDTSAIVDTLRPSLVQPVFRCRGGSLALPRAARGTVIVDDANRLSDTEQRTLLKWLAETSGTIRVISTATMPVFPLVRRRAFVDGLYYRLNTVCVLLGGSDPASTAGQSVR
jgi:hypothetical protein